MSSLLCTLTACLFGGVLSLLLAGWLAFRLPPAGLGRMVAFAAGTMLAAAFLADPWLGVTTTLAVVAHEVPQELGDFVLLSAGWSKRKALLANGASSLASVLGGVVGWAALDGAQGALPYALAVAAGSFLYIAVADLMPLLHQRRRVDGFMPQTALMAAGLLCIPLVGHRLH